MAARTGTVGAKPRYSAAVEPHRVMCPGHYDAVLTVVVGVEAFAGIPPLAPTFALGVLSAAALVVLAAAGLVAFRAALTGVAPRPA